MKKISNYEIKLLGFLLYKNPKSDDLGFFIFSSGDIITRKAKGKNSCVDLVE